MKLGHSCAAIAAARKQICPDAPLVATMSAQFAFDMLGETHRRIDSVPLMGGAAGIGLGISLAKPGIPVIVVDADSSPLMELGGLVTVAHNKPKHFIHFVMNNGVQFNGIVNLPNPGSEPSCAFAAMASAAGYPSVHRIDSMDALGVLLPKLLTEPRAYFIELIVEADPRRVSPQTPQPMIPEIQFVRMRHAVRSLKAALAV